MKIVYVDLNDLLEAIAQDTRSWAPRLEKPIDLGAMADSFQADKLIAYFYGPQNPLADEAASPTLPRSRRGVFLRSTASPEATRSAMEEDAYALLNETGDRTATIVSSADFGDFARAAIPTCLFVEQIVPWALGDGPYSSCAPTCANDFSAHGPATLMEYAAWMDWSEKARFFSIQGWPHHRARDEPAQWLGDGGYTLFFDPHGLPCVERTRSRLLFPGLLPNMAMAVADAEAPRFLVDYFRELSGDDE